MQLYVQAFEGESNHPSFTVPIDDIGNSTTYGTAIHVGRMAARMEVGWSDDRIASACWVVLKVTEEAMKKSR